MAKLGADVIITQRHKRNFLQMGGALPNSRTLYSGQDAQYLAIKGQTEHDNGAITPIYVPDEKVPGAYRLVNRSRVAPGLSTATLVLHENHGSLPFQMFRQNCKFTVYEHTGVCKDISDFNQGWSDYVKIYSGALVTDKAGGDRSAWDSDAAIEDSLSITMENTYAVGGLNFGNKAVVQVTLEVKDILYGTQIRCGDCGVPNNGTNFIYAVQDGTGSAGAKPLVIYSVNGGVTWSTISVATAAAAELIAAIDIVGDKLVLLSPAGGTAASALYYSQLNAITGVPSSTFTKVNLPSAPTANAITDMYVANASQVFFCGKGGYLFVSNDITGDVTVLDAGSATSSDLARITGNDNVIVACGAAATVVKSYTRGATWQITTTNPGAAVGSAIAALDQWRFWYGDASGGVYYTLDGGETWTAKAVGGVPPTAIYDILFATDEVGYVAYLETSLRLAVTINGGWSWTNTSQNNPRVQGWPTIGAAAPARLAVPAVAADPTVSANNLAVAGLGTTTDGVIFLGTALVR